MTSTTTSPIKARQLLAYGSIAALAAVAINVLIYAGGRVADVSYVVNQTASGPEEIRLVHVVGFCLQAFAVGLVAALVANRLGRPSLRSLQILGAVIAVGSTVMDVGIDSALPAKLLLASMHIVTGVAYVAAVQVVRSRASLATEHAPATASRLPVAA